MSPLSARTWAWPILLGTLTASGLVAALFSEAWGDVWSWVALAIPLAVIAWCTRRRPVRNASR